MSKIFAYFRLMRFDKPVGILLLLWPTLWSLWIAAHGMPSFKILAIFILGVILTRAAGCVINDYADRHFDGQVKRTQLRPLASGEVSSKEAFILFLMLGFFALTLVLFLNKLTLILAVIGALLTSIYPFTKRWFALPQIFLGLTFAWGVLMAFGAEANDLPLTAWLIYLAVFFWIFAFDTQYAMVDRDDDETLGINSSALFFGQRVIFWVALSQICMFILFILVGILLGFGFSYFGIMLIASSLIIYQIRLIYSNTRDNCFRAFSNNQWLGMLIFVAILFGIYVK